MPLLVPQKGLITDQPSLWVAFPVWLYTLFVVFSLWLNCPKNASLVFPVNQEGAVSTNVQTLISEETDNLKIQLFWGKKQNKQKPPYKLPPTKPISPIVTYIQLSFISPIFPGIYRKAAVYTHMVNSLLISLTHCSRTYVHMKVCLSALLFLTAANDRCSKTV